MLGWAAHGSTSLLFPEAENIIEPELFYEKLKGDVGHGPGKTKGQIPCGPENG